MSSPITANTQAILLLTAPLIAGRAEDSCERLSPGEYNRLARMLRENQKQPADLTGPDAQAVLDFCYTFDRTRLESLLARGFLLSQAVDRWNARSIWVVSRADAAYPRRLKVRLKEDAPPVLYGCGDAALLDTGGLAVVGSRRVDDELIRYTEGIGRLSAEARRTIVSGAAKGIDRAAMSGALESGGGAAGVMADSLERAALLRDNRDPLMGRRLVLVSPYDPAAGFNVGHAMQRNKLIYALADAAFVVNSDFETGGTWAGAVEQLDRLRFVPVFVRNGENTGKGNAALLRRGGKPWPDPRDGTELAEVLSVAALSVPSEPEQVSISFELSENTPESQPAITAKPETSSADRLLNAVREILGSRLVLPRSEAEVIELLAITKPQAKAWLSRLVEEGVLEKLKKPVRYRAANAPSRPV